MYKKLLVPTDGSEHPEMIAEYVSSVKTSADAEIMVLNVMETSSFANIRSEEVKLKMTELMKKEGKKAVFELSEKLKNDNGNIKIKVALKEGSQADIIIETIKNEEIDLVVIGSSGRRSFDSLFGSVAGKVIKYGECPVLIVN